MSLRVRYPDGAVVTYETAHFLNRNDGYWDLFTKSREDGGRIVASILASSGATVEFTPRYQVNASNEPGLEGVLAMARARICATHEYGRGLGELKRLLRNFDARRQSWADK